MTGILTEEQINEVLSRNVLGRIGTTDGRKTYIVPVNYVYDGKNIIAHSVEGMKLSMMRKNPLVCFETDEMKSFTEWKSVIAWGQFEELMKERDRYSAMKLFVEKMMHIKISETALLPQMNMQGIHAGRTGNSKPVIYRIILNEKTGRFEK